MESGTPDRGPELRPAGAAIRAVTAADAPIVWALLREFAVYEKLSHLVTGDATRLAAHLSGESWPKVEGFVAEDDGVAVGYALYFGLFSSFWAAPMAWLEDLYVRESHRGTGIGRSLMSAVARVAIQRGSVRLAWAVLDWNEPALEFYRRLGAARQTDWHIYQLEGGPLSALAAGNTAGPEPGR